MLNLHSFATERMGCIIWPYVVAQRVGQAASGPCLLTAHAYDTSIERATSGRFMLGCWSTPCFPIRSYLSRLLLSLCSLRGECQS
jgi:hypothetical protein